MKNNLFSNCSCNGKGGSLSLFNYAEVYMEKNYFRDSVGNSGGAIYFFGISLVSITHLKLSYIKSFTSGLYYQSVIDSIIEYCIIRLTFGVMNGVLSTTKLRSLAIRQCFIEKAFSNLTAGSLSFESGEIIISNVLFISSRAIDSGGCLYITGRSKLTIENSMILDSSGYSGGAIAAIGEISFTMKNSSIIMSSGQNGAGLFFEDIRELEINKISLIYCFAENSGTIYLSNKGEMNIRSFEDVNCTNNSGLAGSCLYFESGVQVNLKRFYLINNTNLIFQFVWPNFCFVNLIEFIFIGNYITSGILLTENVFIRAISFYFANNILSHEGDTIVFFDIATPSSNENFFTDAVFHHSHNLSTPSQIKYLIIFSFLDSKILLKNISIDLKIKNYLQIEFFFIFSEGDQNTLRIKDCYFENTPKFNIDSGYIYFTGSTISIESTCFSRIYGIPLIVYNSNVSLNEVIFDENYGEYDIMAEIDSSKIRLFQIITNNSLFSVNSNLCFSIANYDFFLVMNSLFNCSKLNYSKEYSSNQVSALDIQEALSVIIENCVFSNFTNLIGGAIRIESTILISNPSLLIIYSFAILNKAFLGGFLSLYGQYETKIISSIFYKNQAVNSLFNKDFSYDYSGFGGVVLFEKFRHVANLFLLLQNSSFLENSADTYYPTIFSEAEVMSVNNSFVKNIDSLQEENIIIGFPSKIRLKERPDFITSGMPFNLSFQICDYYNYSILLDLNSSGIIKANLRSESSSKFSIRKNVVSSVDNFLNFSNLMISSKSNNTLELILVASLIHFFSGLYDIGSKFSSVNYTFPLYVRACVIGEIITANLSCVPCPKGSYSFSDPMKTITSLQKCKKCLSNAICYGLHLLIPEQGYWIDSNNSELIIQCETAENCVNYYDFEKKTLQKCKLGSKGNLCSYCEKGYGIDFRNFCQYCENTNLECWIILLLVIFLMMIFILGNMRLINSSKIKKSEHGSNPNLFSINLKIFINYIHTSALIFLCKKEFLISTISKLISTFQSLSLVSTSLISCQCFIPSVIRENINMLVFKQISTLLMPIFFWVLSFNYFVFDFWFKTIFKGKNKRPFQKTFLKKISICFVICIYILYPIITKSSFSFFKCQKLSDKNHDTFLSDNPDLICWKGTHIQYLILLSVPGLIIWSISFPLYIFYKGIYQILLVERVKRDLENNRNEKFCPREIKSSRLKFHKNFDKYDVMRFFMGNYKTKHCFWDSLIFLRKFLITFLMSLCSMLTTESSTILILLILYLSWLATLIFQPYKYKYCNIFEVFTLLCNIFTVITSFLLNSNIADSFKIFILTTCLLANTFISFVCFVNIFNFALMGLKRALKDFFGYIQLLKVRRNVTQRNII